MRHTATRRAGFTLIELLVVISIIAVLVALLLPTLGRAKQTAQRVVCLTNQRQIGIMTDLYHNDFKGLFPPYVYDGWLGVDVGTALQVVYGEVANTTKIFICPAAKDKPNIWGDGDPNRCLGGSYYADGGNSYAFNAHLRGSDQWNWWDPGVTMTIDRVSQPANVMWAVDGSSRRFDIIYWIFNSPYRHGGTPDINNSDCNWGVKPGADGFNAGFADGHAAWVAWESWLSWYDAGNWGGNWVGGHPYSWK